MSTIASSDEAFLASFLDDYYAECEDHLAAIRRGLLVLEAALAQGQPLDPEVVEEVFRGFHSLKGLSGMVGVTPAEQLAHRAESYLRLLRRKEVALNADALEAVIAATRLLEQVIAASRRGEPTPDLEAALARMADLSATHAMEQPAPTPSPAAAPPPSPSPPVAPAEEIALTAEERGRLEAALQAGKRAWQITFTPSHALAQRGINVNAVRSRLQDLGELIRAAPVITPEGGISFVFLWATAADPEVFAPWAEDGIRYAPFAAAKPAMTAAPPAVVAAAAAATPVSPAMPAARTEAPPPPAPPAAAPSPAPPSPAFAIGQSVASSTIVVRVDLARLDDLMQMVGELVISRARLEDNLRQMEAVAAALPQWSALQE
ncbi:MAG: Hpt domain-containing protein, partial [Anaerolineae bacterium]|nr:Hpt domain-containing protein [Anaerolineae bacterium]